MSPIVRVLSAYERDPGDALVGEWPLEGIELDELQTLFHVPADDPMYECFPVTERQAEDLQRFVLHEIDITRREYFVEAYRRGPALPSSPLGGVSRRTSREELVS